MVEIKVVKNDKTPSNEIIAVLKTTYPGVASHFILDYIDSLAMTGDTMFIVADKEIHTIHFEEETIVIDDRTKKVTEVSDELLKWF